MSVIVAFFKPGGLGSIHAPGVGQVRASEVIDAGDTTTIAAQDGEMGMIWSGETALVKAAHGATPNAAATAETAATTAAYGVPAGGITPFAPKTGDKVAIAALA